VEEQSRRWRERVQTLLNLGSDETRIMVPDGLDAMLRPYQEQGLTWLAALWDADLGGVLADDMGLGKTLQSLALLERARELAGTGREVIAAGQSFGGLACVELATHRPDLVTAVIAQSASLWFAGDPVPDPEAEGTLLRDLAAGTRTLGVPVVSFPRFPSRTLGEFRSPSVTHRF